MRSIFLLTALASGLTLSAQTYRLDYGCADMLPGCGCLGVDTTGTETFVTVVDLRKRSFMRIKSDTVRVRRLSADYGTDPTTPFVWGVTSDGDARKVSIDSIRFGLLTSEVDGSVTNEIELPSQTGNAGRFLSTNGSAPSWAVISLSNSATLDFPNTNAGESSDLTITVTGAALGDPVNVGVPSTAVVNHSCYTAWVSSVNTVTVRFNNYNSISLADPLSATFKVTVEK